MLLAAFSMIRFVPRQQLGNAPPRHRPWPEQKIFQLASSAPVRPRTPATRPWTRLLEAFIACRTTLDDLSSRAAALGQDVSGPLIAAYLTGKSFISDPKHNILAAAINARLGELSLPAAAPYKGGIRDA
jgi:hypothetical protein